jgi:hypothetical protein
VQFWDINPASSLSNSVATRCKFIHRNKIVVLVSFRIAALGSERAPSCAMHAFVSREKSVDGISFFRLHSA